jgi:lipoprotein-anchoring transpeptidase ErfK/SrfK
VISLLKPPRRRGLLVAALFAAFAVLVAGCSSSGVVVVTVTSTSGSPVSAPDPSSTSASSAASSTAADETSAPTVTSNSVAAMRVTATPSFGSKNIAPATPVTVQLFSATFSSATLTGDDASTLAGKISADGRTWTLSDRMKYGVTYTFKGAAKAADGSAQTVSGTLSTVKPTSTVRASIQIPNGDTVGIAAPIIITFATAITDKAAAEKMLKVTTDKGTIEGSWGWLQDEDIQGNGTKQSIVHFRPAQYWPAYTKVHVEADLYGVNYGNGWGREDITSDFSIGRAQIVKADVSTHRLVVIVDDKIVKDYPVSYGTEADPNLETVSGIHVVEDKGSGPDGSVSMCNPRYGYCGVVEKWAVRINDNGEFIHENDKAIPYLGKANISHGCINMGPADAQDYYKSALYGDPVEVTGTNQPMTSKDSIYDWTYSYDEWKTFSALS